MSANPSDVVRGVSSKTIDKIQDVESVVGSAECAKAWLELQKEIRNPIESSPGKYRSFASLEDQLELYKPLLHKHGFTLRQTIRPGERRDLMITTAEYKTGEFYSSTCPMPISEEVQKYGGNITYFRRYGLDLLLAVQGTKDDGGDDPKDPDGDGDPNNIDKYDPRSDSWPTDADHKIVDNRISPDNFDTRANQDKWKKCEAAGYVIPMGFLKGATLCEIKETVLFNTQMYYTNKPNQNSAAFIEMIKKHLASRKVQK